MKKTSKIYFRTLLACLFLFFFVIFALQSTMNSNAEQHKADLPISPFDLTSTEPTEPTTEATTSETTTTTSETTTEPITKPTTTKPTTTEPTTTKATTTKTKTTQTASPTRQPPGTIGTDVPTLPSKAETDTTNTIHFAGKDTTSESDLISVKFSYDEHFETSFDLEKSEFDSVAKFQLPKEQYDFLVSGENVYLNALGLGKGSDITDEQIADAVKDNQKFNADNANDVIRTWFDLHLMIVSNDSNIYYHFSAETKNARLTIPIPENMRNKSENITVGRIADGKITLVDTLIEGETITFSADSTGSFAILCFPTANLVTFDTGITTKAIIGFILSGIIFLAALFLLIFFYIRKPKLALSDGENTSFDENVNNADPHDDSISLTDVAYNDEYEKPFSSESEYDYTEETQENKSIADDFFGDNEHFDDD